MKVILKKYTTPDQYKKNRGAQDIERFETVKSAIEEVRNVRKLYKRRGEWVGWKIFDKNNEIVHKLR